MCYADKLIVMPEHATLAPPICRLAGEVLSIGRRVTQKGVVVSYYLLSHEPTFCFLQKSFASVVKTNFSYFNESRHRCAVVLIVPDHCKQKETFFLNCSKTPKLNSYRETPADRMCPVTEGAPFSPTTKYLRLVYLIFLYIVDLRSGQFRDLPIISQRGEKLNPNRVQ